MLVKKSLLQIELPEIVACDDDMKIIDAFKKCDRWATAVVSETKECGRVLVVAVYTQELQLQERVFIQEGRFARYESGWIGGMPGACNAEYAYKTSPETRKIVLEFLELEGYSYYDVMQLTGMYLRDKRSEAIYQRNKNKYNTMVGHINSFPGLPKDYEEYCNEFVFKEKYSIVLINKNKKNPKTKCKCLECGKTYNLDWTLKNKDIAVCPKCKSETVAIMERFQGSIKNKGTVLLMNRDGDTLYRRYIITSRTFENMKPVFKSETINYELLTPKKNYFYSFRQRGFGSKYFDKDREPCYSEAHLYTNNINEIHPDGVYQGMNLNRLKGIGSVSLQNLCRSAIKTETAAQLFKIGCFKLAESAEYLNRGITFYEVTGLNACYIRMFKKYNISYQIYKDVKAAAEHVSHVNEEMLEKIIRLCNYGSNWNVDEKREAILERMSFTKMINYFYKQSFITKESYSTNMTLYRDYMTMSINLNQKLPRAKKFDTTTEMYRFPKDIKKAHDAVSEQTVVINDKKKTQQIIRMHKNLTKTHEFRSDGLMISIPKDLADFIREGNTLGHCVGRMPQYSEDHANGTKHTFFIRKIEEPDKPYYTTTINTKTLQITECYGKAHAQRTDAITKFLKKFIKSTYEIKKAKVA